jgi:nucleotide-binding universal stress UspA family protein
MIEKILFPVDFSPACVAMATYVRRSADLFGSEVTLVRVCDLASHNAFEMYVRSPVEIAEEHQSIARQELDSFLESEFPPAKCPRILRSGEASEQIAGVARAGGFDLIVMPTHAGRFRRMLLGSTTAKVLDDADCPVLTTQHAQTAIPKPLEHRVWVCAIGLSTDSERTLRSAGSAAAEVGAKLSIIHAIPDGAPGGEKDARRRLDELQTSVGCKATVQVVNGPVKSALLDGVRRSDADALIIGRRPRSAALGRIGDLTYGMVRDSPCPVLSL